LFLIIYFHLNTIFIKKITDPLVNSFKNDAVSRSFPLENRDLGLINWEMNFFSLMV